MTPCVISFLVYSKIGVYTGVFIFLIFAPKHRVWVLVRTASIHTVYVLSKNKKNIKTFHLKMVIFTPVKNRCILHGRVSVMKGICPASLLKAYKTE